MTTAIAIAKITTTNTMERGVHIEYRIDGIFSIGSTHRSCFEVRERERENE